MALSYIYGYTEVVVGGLPAYRSIETGKIYLPNDDIPNIGNMIDLQQENKLLKAQLKAQTERSDFIEDCIAEMAGVVYNTEETTT